MNLAYAHVLAWDRWLVTVNPILAHAEYPNYRNERLFPPYQSKHSKNARGGLSSLGGGIFVLGFSCYSIGTHDGHLLLWS